MHHPLNMHNVDQSGAFPIGQLAVVHVKLTGVQDAQTRTCQLSDAV